MKNWKKKNAGKETLRSMKLGTFLAVMLALVPCVSAEEHPAEHSHNSVPHELELNKGKKWHADSHTMEYATRMITLLDEFEASREDKTLLGLQTLGGKLQINMDELIRGCTMTGPPHDQLHVWLSGVIPVVATLKDAETVSKGKEVYDQLSPHIKEFTEYFTLID
jgi:hypothetical protein